MSDEKDLRIWRYKGREAKLFARIEDVPEGEGWRDSPYDPEPASAEVERRKPGRPRKVDVEDAPNGDSDGN